MEISTEEVLNGLLEENKRLTLENIILKTTLQKMREQEKPAEE